MPNEPVTLRSLAVEVDECANCDGMGFGYPAHDRPPVDCPECDGTGLLKDGKPWPPRPVMPSHS